MLNKGLILGWIISCILCVTLGWKLKKDPDPVVIVKREVEQGKKETLIVEKRVEKITKPDGTIIERQIENTKNTKLEKNTAKNVVEPMVSVSKYSLDLRYLPSITAPPSYKDVAIDLGYRVGTSNVWITTGYEVKHNQFTVGVRYEW